VLMLCQHVARSPSRQRCLLRVVDPMDSADTAHRSLSK
jgi:hypothetical protein